MPLRYELLDVFTEVPFGGNQLAVFPDGRDLSYQTMGRLARELNFSETTFVFPTTDPRATHLVRIFTPGAEVPFAGHPTVGTAILLAMQEPERKPRYDYVFEEGVGLVPVTVTHVDGRWRAELTAAQMPERSPAPEPAVLARVLGLSPDDIEDGDAAPAVFSCGLPFTFLRVRSLEALGRASIRTAEWLEHPHARTAPMLYLYTLDTHDPYVQVRSRMFAPDIGVSEDAATGSAASALAGALVAAAPPSDGLHRVMIKQGVEMGRPSDLELSMTTRGGQILEVKVAGGAVHMGGGDFLPKVHGE